MSAAPSFDAQPMSSKAVIGKGVVVVGQIHSREDLTIEGEVEGTIDMAGHRLTIDGLNLPFDRSLYFDDTRLDTRANAALAVDKVYIRKGATFVGDIHSSGIIIEDGGYIKGKIDLSQHGNGKVNGSAAGH